MQLALPRRRLVTRAEFALVVRGREPAKQLYRFAQCQSSITTSYLLHRISPRSSLTAATSPLPARHTLLVVRANMGADAPPSGGASTSAGLRGTLLLAAQSALDLLADALERDLARLVLGFLRDRDRQHAVLHVGVGVIDVGAV